MEYLCHHCRPEPEPEPEPVKQAVEQTPESPVQEAAKQEKSPTEEGNALALCNIYLSCSNSVVNMALSMGALCTTSMDYHSFVFTISFKSLSNYSTFWFVTNVFNILHNMFHYTKFSPILSWSAWAGFSLIYWFVLLFCVACVVQWLTHLKL